MTKIKFLFVLLLLNNIVFAQDSIHVFQSADMTTTTTISIFGNMSHDGENNIGTSGAITFFGNTWTNGFAAKITGTGKVVFQNPRPAPYAGIFPLTLSGGNFGFSQPAFPAIDINNINDVFLNNTSTKITNALNFIAGHVNVNDENLVMASTAGIEHYNQNRYIITSAAGGLIKENLSGPFDFPVGNSADNYTPARLNNTGVPDNYKVRVMDNYVPFASAPQEGVFRTWEIKEKILGGSDIELMLQHNISTEGFSYTNTNSFITRYVGINPNNSGGAISNSVWDYTGTCEEGSITGAIVDLLNGEIPIVAASTQKRKGITENFGIGGYTYYSKSICEFDNSPLNVNVLPLKLLSFSGSSINCTSTLKWVTSKDDDTKYFQIQQSNDAVGYETIATVDPSAAVVNNDVKAYAYSFKQSSPLIYYRLKQVGDDDKYMLSKTVSIASNCGSNNESLHIYPNPVATSNIALEWFNDDHDCKSAVVTIIDIAGKIVLTKNLTILYGNNINLINVQQLQKGMYLVKLQTNAKVIKNKNAKIVIL